METSSGDAKKVIGALLVGAAVGTAVGILFAPAKGTKTRKAIVEKGEDLTDAMKDRFNEFMDTVKSEYENIKSKATGHFSENGSMKKEEMKVK